MHAQPQNIQFLQEEASPPPRRAIHSMRRTLSWCYPAFRHIRRVVVVDLYAVALERLPAGASILSKMAKLRFYRRPRLSPGSWELEGYSPTQSKKRPWGVAYTPPIPSAQQPGQSQARARTELGFA
jgi:hypothetical protein